MELNPSFEIALLRHLLALVWGITSFWYRGESKKKRRKCFLCPIPSEQRIPFRRLIDE